MYIKTILLITVHYCILDSERTNKAITKRIAFQLCVFFELFFYEIYSSGNNGSIIISVVNFR